MRAIPVDDISYLVHHAPISPGSTSRNLGDSRRDPTAEALISGSDAKLAHDRFFSILK
jgi:hypothetical protein